MGNTKSASIMSKVSRKISRQALSFPIASDSGVIYDKVTTLRFDKTLILLQTSTYFIFCNFLVTDHINKVFYLLVTSVTPGILNIVEINCVSSSKKSRKKQKFENHLVTYNLLMPNLLEKRWLCL